MTVVSHKPSAPSVPSRLQARQMAAAMREAIPSGDVHSTAVTILPITVLKTCAAIQHMFLMLIEAPISGRC